MRDLKEHELSKALLSGERLSRAVARDEPLITAFGMVDAWEADGGLAIASQDPPFQLAAEEPRRGAVGARRRVAAGAISAGKP